MANIPLACELSQLGNNFTNWSRRCVRMDEADNCQGLIPDNRRSVSATCILIDPALA